MASSYKEYLAGKVLSDGEIITYRALGRALKVHCNVAKKMLYDFYTTQNARKSGSIHACYLVTGSQGRTSLSTAQSNGTVEASQVEGAIYQGDSFLSSSIPEPERAEEIDSVKLTTAILVTEEKLQDVKKLFETVTSMHIYSIEPGPRLSNIQILSDSNRKIAVEHASDDLMTTWKEYGTIHNPYAKKRTMQAPPPAPAPAPAMTSAMKPTGPVSRDNEQATIKPERPSTESTVKPTSKAPAQPKRGNANIFQSFAKAKSQQSQPPKKDATREQEMKLESDSDDNMEEDFPAIEESAEVKAKAEANKQARLEREANLRRMMEEPDEADDEKMPDAPDALEDEDDDEEEKDADKDSDNDSMDAAALDTSTPMISAPKAAATSSASTTSNVTVSNGRRRGRRRVMKKTTTTDAEGCLVTKTEPDWESFSEEDVPAPLPAQQKQSQPSSFRKSTNTASSSAAGKKGSAGQGSIMSFFQKK